MLYYFEPCPSLGPQGYFIMYSAVGLAPAKAPKWGRKGEEPHRLIIVFRWGQLMWNRRGQIHSAHSLLCEILYGFD